MKQIIINITTDEDGKTTIIVNAIYDDVSKQNIVSVLNEEDNKFIKDIKALLENYVG